MIYRILSLMSLVVACAEMSEHFYLNNPRNELMKTVKRTAGNRLRYCRAVDMFAALDRLSHVNASAY